MKTKKILLKVKIKSLAEEAKIIRKEERKFKKRDIQLFTSLRYHRIGTVREEARWSQIAYGYLRGRSYEQIERKTQKLVNWTRVRQLVQKFGRCWDGDESYTQYKQDQNNQDVNFEKWIHNAKIQV